MSASHDERTGQNGETLRLHFADCQEDFHGLLVLLENTAPRPRCSAWPRCGRTSSVRTLDYWS